MQTLKEAWRFLKRPPTSFKIAIFIAATTFYGTAGFILFERPGKPELQWLDGLWWAVVSMTTVGYGDHFPVTELGRFFVGYPIMLIGMGMVAYALSQLASFFIRAESLNRRGLIMRRFDDHVVVCGYPSRHRFAQVLQEIRGHPLLGNVPVVLIDEDLDELLPTFAAANVHFVRGNASLQEVLHRAAVDAAARVLVLALKPEPKADLFTAAVCIAVRNMRPDIHVVVECIDASNQDLLAHAGAHATVCLQNLAPIMMVRELQSPGVTQVLNELVWLSSGGDSVLVVPVNVGAQARTVDDLVQWARAHDMTLVGVRQRSGVRINPPAKLALNEGDAAIILGPEAPTAIEL
jgi:voltage-gated potassium channel